MCRNPVITYWCVLTSLHRYRLHTGSLDLPDHTASPPPLQNTATGLPTSGWADERCIKQAVLFFFPPWSWIYSSQCIFLSASLIPLPPSSSSSTFSQVAVLQPHSHGSRLSSLPGLGLWSTPLGDSTRDPGRHSSCKCAATLELKTGRTAAFGTFFFTQETHTHTVRNTDTYACNLDTQQSTFLLLRRPPSGRCYFWPGLGHMSLGSACSGWLIKATSKQA